MLDELVVKAFAFAYRAHRHTTRKGSPIPYIIHPLNVATILMRYDASDELIAAALLHDVVEDENVSFEELEANFGKEVCFLVKSVSEPAVLREKHPDRRKTWKDRKQHTVDSMLEASYEVKMLSCADKLANLSDTVGDYEVQGEKIWNRFNAPKQDQEWYYKSLIRTYASGSNSIEQMKIFTDLVKQITLLFGLAE